VLVEKWLAFPGEHLQPKVEAYPRPSQGVEDLGGSGVVTWIGVGLANEDVVGLRGHGRKGGSTEGRPLGGEKAAFGRFLQGLWGVRRARPKAQEEPHEEPPG